MHGLRVRDRHEGCSPVIFTAKLGDYLRQMQNATLMAPQVTDEMRRLGLVWKQVDDEFIQVCYTCGGNCGQCGITGRIGNVPPSLDRIIETTQNDPNSQP